MGKPKSQERKRVCIYQAQVVWIGEKQRGGTAVDVTLQASFGSGENLEFEETAIAGIFSFEHI